MLSEEIQLATKGTHLNNVQEGAILLVECAVTLIGKVKPTLLLYMPSHSP